MSVATTLATAYFQLVPSMGGDEAKMRTHINRFATGAGQEGGRRLGAGMTSGASAALANTSWSQRLVGTMNRVGTRLGQTTGTGLGSSIQRGLGAFLTSSRVQGMLVPMVNSMQRVASVAKETLGQGFQVAAGMASAAVSGLTALVVKALPEGIARADTLNRFPKMMKNMGFSADDASKSIKKIADHLDGLPTTTDEVAATVQRLTPIVSGGIEEATDVALALNDAMLAGSGNAVLAAQGMEQYAQMLAVGKPDMMAWRSMMRAMPQQLDMIARALLGPTANSMELYEAMKTGTLSFEDFNKALVELDKNGAEGLKSFAEQAKTSVQGIGTSLGLMVTRMGKAIGDFLGKVGVDKISSALDSVSLSYKNAGNVIGDAFVNPVDRASKAVGGWMLVASQVFRLTDFGLAKLMSSGSKLATVFNSMDGLVGKTGRLSLGMLQFVALLGSMWTASEKFRQACHDLIAPVKELFAAGSGGAEAWRVFNEVMGEAAKLLGDSLAIVIETMVIPGLRLLNQALLTASKAFDSLSSDSNGIGAAVKKAIALAVAFSMFSHIPGLNLLSKLATSMFPMLGAALTGLLGPLGKFGTSILSIIPGLGGMAAGASKGSTVLGVLGGVFRGLTSPIGLVTMAVTGLVAAFKNWDTIKEWGANLKNGIFDVRDNVLDWLGEVTERFKNWAHELPLKALNVGASFANQVRRWGTETAAKIPEFFKGVTDAIHNWAHGDAPNAVAGASGDMADGVRKAMGEMPGAALNKAREILDNIKSGLGDLGTALANWVKTGLPAMIEALGDIYIAFGDWFMTFDWVTAMGDLGGKLCEWVADGIHTLRQWLKDHLIDPKDFFKKLEGGELWEDLKEKLNLDDATEKLRNWWNNIDWEEVLETAKDKIRDAVANCVDKGLSEVEEIAGFISDCASYIAGWIVAACEWVAEHPDDCIAALGKALMIIIKGAVGLGGVIAAIGGAFKEGIINGIEEHFDIDPDSFWGRLLKALICPESVLYDYIIKPIKDWFNGRKNPAEEGADSAKKGDNRSFWRKLFDWITNPVQLLIDIVVTPVVNWFKGRKNPADEGADNAQKGDSPAFWRRLLSWILNPGQALLDLVVAPVINWFKGRKNPADEGADNAQKGDNRSFWQKLFSWITNPLQALVDLVVTPVVNWFKGRKNPADEGADNAQKGDSPSFWKKLFSWITNPVQALVDLVVTPVVNWFKGRKNPADEGADNAQKGDSPSFWQKLLNWILNPAQALMDLVVTPVVNWFKGRKNPADEGADNAQKGDSPSFWQRLLGWITSPFTWLYDHIVAPVVNWFRDRRNPADEGADSAQKGDSPSFWSRLFSWITSPFTWLNDHVLQPIKNWFSGFDWESVKSSCRNFDFGSFISGIFSWLTGGDFGTWLHDHIWQPIADWFSTFDWESLWPLAAVLVPGAAPVMAALFIWNNSDDVKTWLHDHVWQPIADWFGSFDFGGLFDAAPDFSVGDALGKVFSWYSNIGTWLDEHIWTPIKDWFTNKDWDSATSPVENSTGSTWDRIRRGATGAWGDISDGVRSAWDRITGNTRDGGNRTADESDRGGRESANRFGRGLGRIIGETTSKWGANKNETSSQLAALAGAVQNLTQRVVHVFGSVLRGTISAAREIMQAVYSQIHAIVSNIPGMVGVAMSAVASTAASALSGLYSVGWNAGIALGNGLQAGIQACFGNIMATCRNLTNALPNWKGPYSLDLVLLKPNGVAIMKGLQTGMEEEIPSVRALLEGLTTDIPLMMDTDDLKYANSILDAGEAHLEALGGPKITIVNNNPRERDEFDQRAEVADGIRLAEMLR